MCTIMSYPAILAARSKQRRQMAKLKFSHVGTHCRPHFPTVNRQPNKTPRQTECGLLVCMYCNEFQMQLYHTRRRQPNRSLFLRTCPCEHEDGEESLPQRHCTAAVSVVVVPEDEDEDVEEAAAVGASDHSKHYNHSSIPLLFLRRHRRRARLLRHSRLL